MKVNCQSKVEYIISKHMFFKFLNTHQIKSTLGAMFIDSVEEFVKTKVEVYEKHFCFYLRKKQRHFDEYINSLHEGTNIGLRHSVAPVGPSTTIENAMVVMTNNANQSITSKKIKNSRDVMLSCPLLSILFLMAMLW